jgi:hypothetical protein
MVERFGRLHYVEIERGEAEFYEQTRVRSVQLCPASSSRFDMVGF